MFKTIKIESNLELQYNLIDIRDGEKRFIFSFKCFDDNHTSTPQAYRLKMWCLRHNRKLEAEVEVPSLPKALILSCRYDIL